MPAMTSWRCAICRCSLDAARRKRWQLGIRAMRPGKAICTPACQRPLVLKKAREKMRRLNAIAISDPRRGEWACSECSATLDQAEAKRRRLGLPPIRRGPGEGLHASVRRRTEAAGPAREVRQAPPEAGRRADTYGDDRASGAERAFLDEIIAERARNAASAKGTDDGGGG
jgi:hypothetical protein